MQDAFLQFAAQQAAQAKNYDADKPTFMGTYNSTKRLLSPPKDPQQQATKRTSASGAEARTLPLSLQLTPLQAPASVVLAGGANATNPVAQRKLALAAQSMEKAQPGELGDDSPAELERHTHEPQAEKTPPVIMHGRLRSRSHVWASFVRSSWVMAWILFGFPLMWKADAPLEKAFHNHQSAFDNADFVTQSIQDLLATQAAAVADFPLRCVLPLGVVTRASTGKQRLIFDARYINDHLVIPKFKYETLSTIHEVVHRNDFMFVIDLKSGYHHLDMRCDAYPYLGFFWQGQYYYWKQLPFGLAPACWAFTKLTRELTGKWRAQGFRCTSYIDDIFHAAPSFPSAVDQRIIAVADMEAGGCVINHPKSFPTPRQSQAFIGATVDSVQGTLFVPPEKKLRVLSTITYALQAHPGPTVHSVQSIVGQIISLSFSFGRIAIMMTRDMTGWVTDQIAEHSYLAHHRHYKLSKPAIQELEFWLEAFDTFDGIKPLWRPPFVHTIIHTDAAGDAPMTFGGWGGWTQDFNGALIMAAGRWPWPSRYLSSTLLELEAIRLTLESFCQDGKLDGQRILLRSDNQGVMYIVNKGGSMAPHLHAVTREILWHALGRNIDLMVEWIPRTENELADHLSKLVFSSDLQLNPRVFLDLSKKFGPFRTDLFASHTNWLIPKFYSYHHVPGTSGINAFAHRWGEKEWCNPPFKLVGRAIQHARVCQASMCLIAPFWPNAPWWHNLVHSGSCFKPFVRAWEVLPRRPDLFLTLDKLPAPAVSWHTLAILCDFTTQYYTALPLPAL